MKKLYLLFAFGAIVTGLLSSCDKIENRMNGLEQMIQTVTVIPAYNDGSLDGVKNTLEINCLVTPASAVASLEKDCITVLMTTAEKSTKAGDITEIKIVNGEDFVKDAAKGTFSVKVDISGFAATKGESLMVAVNVKNGVSDFTTGFVNVFKIAADLVVYGKIFTSDNDKVVEAFAVKDGKFIYVGDKAGVLPYLEEGTTQVVDHTDKGIIIPGCYEGHAHYLMANGMNLMGGPMLRNDCTPDEFKTEVKKAYDIAKAAGKSSIYGFGWLYQYFVVNMPTRQELDAICPDIALFVSDAEGHKGLANTKCLVNAGIMKEDGTVLKRGTDIRGGEISMGADGTPDGLLKEQAGTYVRNRGIRFNEIFPSSLGMQAVAKSQEQLLANGYVSYMDGWSNYYGTEAFYEGAKSLEQAGDLNILLGMSYEFESSSELGIEGEIAKAKSMKKYTGGHINADYVKIFIDGTVESGTGFTMEPYQETSFGHGMVNWGEDEVTKITELANNNGMTMHVHTMGDAAVHRAVKAFEAKGKKDLRNTVVHARNVPQEDFARMAANDIVAVSGMLWHGMALELALMLSMIVPENMVNDEGLMAYPMKSYFDAKAVMTSHTDYPATSGSPIDPFGIMEIAVSGQMHTDEGVTYPFWTAELISREQALQALTINGAYQMHVENERGSIEVGKYADFVLADKDVLKCAQDDIHNAKVVSTWFEGKKVY